MGLKGNFSQPVIQYLQEMANALWLLAQVLPTGHQEVLGCILVAMMQKKESVVILTVDYRASTASDLKGTDYTHTQEIIRVLGVPAEQVFITPSSSISAGDLRSDVKLRLR